MRGHELRPIVLAMARKERLTSEEIAAIGRRVHDAIRRAGMNRHHFSNKIEIAQQTIWSWEKGKTQPELPLLFKIARALRVPVHTFFTDDTVPGTGRWLDTEAWEELSRSGKVDAYRARGLSEAQIEAARRFPFASPTPTDYTRLLDAAWYAATEAIEAGRSHLRRKEA